MFLINSNGFSGLTALKFKFLIKACAIFTVLNNFIGVKDVLINFFEEYPTISPIDCETLKDMLSCATPISLVDIAGSGRLSKSGGVDSFGFTVLDVSAPPMSPMDFDTLDATPVKPYL